MKEEWKQKIIFTKEVDKVMNKLRPEFQKDTSFILAEIIGIVPDDSFHFKEFKKLTSPESMDKIAMKVYVNNLIKQSQLNVSNYANTTPKPDPHKDTSGTILE